MNYGRYFWFDNAASDIARGITVFGYRPDGDNVFPVYLTISEDRVEFNVVSTSENGQILSLPLRDNLVRDLSDSLVGAYSKTFIMPCFERFLKSKDTSLDTRGYFSTFFEFKKESFINSGDNFPLAKLVLDFLFDLS